MKQLIGLITACLVLVAVTGSILVRLLRWYEMPSSIPRHLKLEVTNGCGQPRAGDAVMKDLQRRGFNVFRTKNSAHHYTRTTVVDLCDPTGANAHAVAQALGVRPKVIGIPAGKLLTPAVTVQLDSSLYLDVRVVIGEDFKRFFPSAFPLY
ncbi:MAG: LytR C-terminal domain-containing protein [candidate division WOR-3 bacterium]